MRHIWWLDIRINLSIIKFPTVPVIWIKAPHKLLKIIYAVALAV